jgi:hypothetical protein
MSDKNPDHKYCRDCMKHSVEGGNFFYDVCNKEITKLSGGIVEPVYEVKIKYHDPTEARAKGGFCGPEAKYFEYRDNKKARRDANRNFVFGLFFIAIPAWSLMIYLATHWSLMIYLVTHYV